MVGLTKHYRGKHFFVISETPKPIFFMEPFELKHLIRQSGLPSSSKGLFYSKCPILPSFAQNAPFNPFLLK